MKLNTRYTNWSVETKYFSLTSSKARIINRVWSGSIGLGICSTHLSLEGVPGNIFMHVVAGHGSVFLIINVRLSSSHLWSSAPASKTQRKSYQLHLAKQINPYPTGLYFCGISRNASTTQDWVVFHSIKYYPVLFSSVGTTTWNIKNLLVETNSNFHRQDFYPVILIWKAVLPEW